MNNETLLIQGAVGSLEVLYELPDAVPNSIAVICHPHPLFQGTMHNKVAYMLARSLKQNDAVAVRFNFRGVGKSDGEYADGIGEVDDVLAVLEWAKGKWPSLPVVLAGFSFGSYVALLTMQNTQTIEQFNIHRLITVAPPVGRWDFEGVGAPQCPFLVIQGTEDELVDAKTVRAWCDQQGAQTTYHSIAEADHFFHGKLSILRGVVLDWMKV